MGSQSVLELDAKIALSVCGIPGSIIEYTDTKDNNSFTGGTGKSWLCRRFFSNSFNDFDQNHYSVINLSDFSGRVINNDHFIFWGRFITKVPFDKDKSKKHDSEEMDFTNPQDASSHFLINVVEQTEFIDDLSLKPFKTSSGKAFECYNKRCLATKLQSKQKLIYISRDQLGLEDEYPQIYFPADKVDIDGYMICYDVSYISDPLLLAEARKINSQLESILMKKSNLAFSNSNPVPLNANTPPTRHKSDLTSIFHDNLNYLNDISSTQMSESYICINKSNQVYSNDMSADKESFVAIKSESQRTENYPRTFSFSGRRKQASFFAKSRIPSSTSTNFESVNGESSHEPLKPSGFNPKPPTVNSDCRRVDSLQYDLIRDAILHCRKNKKALTISLTKIDTLLPALEAMVDQSQFQYFYQTELHAKSESDSVKVKDPLFGIVTPNLVAFLHRLETWIQSNLLSRCGFPSPSSLNQTSPSNAQLSTSSLAGYIHSIPIYATSAHINFNVSAPFMSLFRQVFRLRTQSIAKSKPFYSVSNYHHNNNRNSNESDLSPLLLDKSIALAIEQRLKSYHHMVSVTHWLRHLALSKADNINYLPSYLYRHSDSTIDNKIFLPYYLYNFDDFTLRNDVGTVNLFKKTPDNTFDHVNKTKLSSATSTYSLNAKTNFDKLMGKMNNIHSTTVLASQNTSKKFVNAKKLFQSNGNIAHQFHSLNDYNPSNEIIVGPLKFEAISNAQNKETLGKFVAPFVTNFVEALEILVYIYQLGHAAFSKLLKNTVDSHKKFANFREMINFLGVSGIQSCSHWTQKWSYNTSSSNNSSSIGKRSLTHDGFLDTVKQREATLHHYNFPHSMNYQSFDFSDSERSSNHLAHIDFGKPNPVSFDDGYNLSRVDNKIFNQTNKSSDSEGNCGSYSKNHSPLIKLCEFAVNCLGLNRCSKAFDSYKCQMMKRHIQTLTNIYDLYFLNNILQRYYNQLDNFMNPINDNNGEKHNIISKSRFNKYKSYEDFKREELANPSSAFLKHIDSPSSLDISLNKSPDWENELEPYSLKDDNLSVAHNNNNNIDSTQSQPLMPWFEKPLTVCQEFAAHVEYANISPTLNQLTVDEIIKDPNLIISYSHDSVDGSNYKINRYVRIPHEYFETDNAVHIYDKHIMKLRIDAENKRLLRIFQDMLSKFTQYPDERSDVYTNKINSIMVNVSTKAALKINALSETQKGKITAKKSDSMILIKPGIEFQDAWKCVEQNCRASPTYSTVFHAISSRLSKSQLTSAYSNHHETLMRMAQQHFWTLLFEHLSELYEIIFNKDGGTDDILFKRIETQISNLFEKNDRWIWLDLLPELRSQWLHACISHLQNQIFSSISIIPNPSNKNQIFSFDKISSESKILATPQNPSNKDSVICPYMPASSFVVLDETKSTDHSIMNSDINFSCVEAFLQKRQPIHNLNFRMDGDKFLPNINNPTNHKILKQYPKLSKIFELINNQNPGIILCVDCDPDTYDDFIQMVEIMYPEYKYYWLNDKSYAPYTLHCINILSKDCFNKHDTVITNDELLHYLYVQALRKNNQSVYLGYITVTHNETSTPKPQTEISHSNDINKINTSNNYDIDHGQKIRMKIRHNNSNFENQNFSSSLPDQTNEYSNCKNNIPHYMCTFLDPKQPCDIIFFWATNAIGTDFDKSEENTFIYNARLNFNSMLESLITEWNIYSGFAKMQHNIKCHNNLHYSNNDNHIHNAVNREDDINQERLVLTFPWIRFHIYLPCLSTPITPNIEVVNNQLSASFITQLYSLMMQKSKLTNSATLSSVVHFIKFVPKSGHNNPYALYVINRIKNEMNLNSLTNKTENKSEPQLMLVEFHIKSYHHRLLNNGKIIDNIPSSKEKTSLVDFWQNEIAELKLQRPTGRNFDVINAHILAYDPCTPYSLSLIKFILQHGHQSEHILANYNISLMALHEYRDKNSSKHNINSVHNDKFDFTDGLCFSKSSMYQITQDNYKAEDHQNLDIKFVNNGKNCEKVHTMSNGKDIISAPLNHHKSTTKTTVGHNKIASENNLQDESGRALSIQYDCHFMKQQSFLENLDTLIYEIYQQNFGGKSPHHNQISSRTTYQPAKDSSLGYKIDSHSTLMNGTVMMDFTKDEALLANQLNANNNVASTGIVREKIKAFGYSASHEPLSELTVSPKMGQKIKTVKTYFETEDIKPNNNDTKQKQLQLIKRERFGSKRIPKASSIAKPNDPSHLIIHGKETQMLNIPHISGHRSRIAKKKNCEFPQLPDLISQLHVRDELTSPSSIVNDKMFVSKIELLEKNKLSGKMNQKSVNTTHKHDLPKCVVKEAKIPPAFIKCIEYIEKEGIFCEGIYRVPGSKTQVDLLLKKLNSNSTKFNIADLDIQVNAVGTAIKTFLSDLSEPLIPSTLIDKLIVIGNLNDSKDQVAHWKTLVREILSNDPQFNFLKYVLDHLNRLGNFCETTCMTTRNLAKCFWPTLIRPDFTNYESMTLSAAPLEESLYILIKHFDMIFT